MKVYRPMPIDYTLKALECTADQKGLRLEDVPGYVSLCEFLTDIEDNDQPSTWISGADAYEILKKCIAYVVPGWVGSEMEFHQKCQPSGRVVAP